MPSVQVQKQYICTSCLRQRFDRLLSQATGKNGSTGHKRSFSSSSQVDNRAEERSNAHEQKVEIGAMSQRLQDMSENNLQEGGRSAQKALEEAGFSEELREKLGARVQESKFRSDNAAAFAQLNLPSSAGKGTREIAAAQSWSGSEKLEDAALRMLNDAHKPLRGAGPPKIPIPRGPPSSVDLRMRKALQKSKGERLANVRDRTSIYALSQDPTMTEKEREQMRKQLKERFTPAARPMPGTIQGLAALANERIEDAIARGQFKNIPRGKGKNIERDYTASSPFLDTTEYFMNKIIQKQEIVPPWIEKQQELVKAAATFRSRLRADWKRHAARFIASKGGSLEAQVGRAMAYAAAEAANNPRAQKVEAFSEIDNQGKILQVTIKETAAPADDSQGSTVTVTEALAGPSDAPETRPLGIPHSESAPITGSPVLSHDDESVSSSKEELPLPRVFPFRDPAWESLEHAYHTLAVTNLNSLTRSYNLMAPDLAKKPYFSLQRELRSCFSDVAPQLAGEIQERAKAPSKVRIEVVGHRPGGILEKFGGEHAKVFDSQKPHYGFKEFWRDLWGGEKEKAV